MKSGTNYFTVFAADASGNGVADLVAGWAATGQIGATNLTLTGVTSAYSTGYYNAQVDLVAGQGYFAVTNSSSAVDSISPQFFPLDVDSHDVDELYGKFTSIGVANLPLASPQRFSVISLVVKQETAIVENVQVPAIFAPLAGISGMAITCYPATSVISTTAAALSGTYSATVVDVSAGIVEVVIGSDVLTNIVPEGKSNVNIYGDLRYTDSDGYKRRPVEFRINVRREF